MGKDALKRTTVSGKELARRLKIARQMPALAHLPACGLMAPAGWNFHDPELLARAERILQREGTAFTRIDQTAPALFWFEGRDGQLQLHDWDEVKAWAGDLRPGGTA